MNIDYLHRINYHPRRRKVNMFDTLSCSSFVKPSNCLHFISFWLKCTSKRQSAFEQGSRGWARELKNRDRSRKGLLSTKKPESRVSNHKKRVFWVESWSLEAEGGLRREGSFDLTSCGFTHYCGYRGTDGWTEWFEFILCVFTSKVDILSVRQFHTHTRLSKE